MILSMQALLTPSLSNANQLKNDGGSKYEQVVYASIGVDGMNYTI